MGTDARRYSSGPFAKILITSSTSQRRIVIHTRNNNGKAAGNAHKDGDDAGKAQE
jgi:hypothetical protein